jgi:hypothetical protein
MENRKKKNSLAVSIPYIGNLIRGTYDLVKIN